MDLGPSSSANPETQTPTPPSPYAVYRIPSTFPVASFLVFVRPDPLLSINSVASFFKNSQLSTLGDQLAVPAPPFRRLPTADCLLPAALPPDYCLPAPNGGFVPGFRKARSFVINQLGGFVFQKTLSFQPSAASLPRHTAFSPTAYRWLPPFCRLRCLLPTVFRPPNGGFVPGFR